MSKRCLDVWMNGELVGRWRISRGDDEFSYAKTWLASPTRRPISLSMPLQRSTHIYRGSLVRAYFDNLLPDAELMRRRIQRRFRTHSTGAFELLHEIGRDCVGAIALLPPDSGPHDPRRIDAEAIDESKIEAILQDTTRDAAFGQQTTDFRISLAGTQEKTALLRYKGRWHEPKGSTPTTHIFKLPIGQAAMGIDLSTSVENEWLCHKILQAYGIPVANCEMAQFGEQRALVVERFDRRWSQDRTWIARLPQEDLCQAMGLPASQKYENDGGPGIKSILDLLRGSRSATNDRLDFYRTQLVFWLLCAIDGHAKNFSLFIEPLGRFRSTPRYDVLSAYPVLGHGTGKLSRREVRMAMAAWGKNRHYNWDRIQRRHWERVGTDCGLNNPREVIDQLAQVTPEVITTVQSQLPGDFPDRVAQPVLKGLREAAALLSSSANPS